jgi:hypothetical protein
MQITHPPQASDAYEVHTSAWNKPAKISSPPPAARMGPVAPCAHAAAPRGWPGPRPAPHVSRGHTAPAATAPHAGAVPTCGGSQGSQNMSFSWKTCSLGVPLVLSNIGRHAAKGYAFLIKYQGARSQGSCFSYPISGGMQLGIGTIPIQHNVKWMIMWRGWRGRPHALQRLLHPQVPGLIRVGRDAQVLRTWRVASSRVQVVAFSGCSIFRL